MLKCRKIPPPAGVCTDDLISWTQRRHEVIIKLQPVQHPQWIWHTESYNVSFAFMPFIILLILVAFGFIHHPIVIISLISVISVWQGCAHWSEVLQILWINASSCQCHCPNSQTEFNYKQFCRLKKALFWHRRYWNRPFNA